MTLQIQPTVLKSLALQVNVSGNNSILRDDVSGNAFLGKFVISRILVPFTFD